MTFPVFTWMTGLPELPGTNGASISTRLGPIPLTFPSSFVATPPPRLLPRTTTSSPTETADMSGMRSRPGPSVLSSIAMASMSSA